MALNIDELYDKIYRYCYYKVYDSNTAEDITQETFLRYFKSDVKPDNTQAVKYLYTIARNLCIDEYRRIKPLPLADSSKADNNNLDENLSLKIALESLSDEDRDLIILRYVNEVPVNVLCKMYNISRFALYRRTKGILKKLREQM